MKGAAEEAKGLRRPAAGAVGGWPGHALPQRPKAVAKAGIRACGAPRRDLRESRRGGNPRLPTPKRSGCPCRSMRHEPEGFHIR